MDTVNEVIEQAKAAKAFHGYNAQAVICKSFYSARKYSIGFHFQDGMAIGDEGEHPDGSKFEVLAIV